MHTFAWNADSVNTTEAGNTPAGLLIYNHQSQLFNLHFKVS